MKQKKLNTINFNSFKLFNKLFSNWITIKSDVNNLLPFMAETLCAPSFIENLDHRNQTAAHVCVRVALKCHCWGHISMSSIYTYRSICIHIDDFLHDNHRPIPRKRCKQPTNQASTMLYFSACRFIIIIFPFFSLSECCFSILF